MPSTKYPSHPILLVDDEKQALVSYEMALRSMGMNNMIRCPDSREVFSILEGREIEIMFLDLVMPHVSGEEILAKVTVAFPEVPVIVCTGMDEVEMAVKCLRQGAYDYIVKPVDAGRLAASLRRAVEARGLRRENTRLTHRFLTNTLERPEAFAHIVTGSKSMEKIFQYCEAVAPGPEPVLVTGETGVGKELIARALHAVSGRTGEFVAVNVAGLDDNVFADTLFGHRKGAFTGADRARPGLIEKAAGGTLFLDEIGDLSESSQVKLLRVLQEREYYPVGADMAKPTDARIVVATHANLETRMREGKFRQDLFYRLGTHHVNLPPLRRRMEDVPLLLGHFLREAAGELGRDVPTYHPALLNLLGAHDFPGNIRELRAMVFDAVSSHRSRMLSMKVFKSRISGKIPGITEEGSEASLAGEESWVRGLRKLPTLKEAGEQLIAEAMRRAGNNQRAAASVLGISHQALNKRLKRSAS